MARPLKFDRDTVIETAMHEIWRKGYEATSVSAMSEKLGLTRSSYYNAFGARADLFRAALAAYSAQSPDRVLQDTPAAGGIRRHLTSLFRAACAARAGDSEGRGCMMVNALCELAGGPEADLSDLLVSSVMHSVERLDALLAAGVATGELPATTDCHGHALALQSLLVGLNAMSKAVRNEDDLWLAARTALAALGLLDITDAAPKGGPQADTQETMVAGLSHITFITRDLDRTEAVLTGVLGAKKVYDSGDTTFSVARERFFDVAGLWIAIMEGDPLPTQTYNHLAFKIAEADYDACLARITALGLDLRTSRARVNGEGRSIYFYDDDNHLFELHTGTLAERLARYAT